MEPLNYFSINKSGKAIPIYDVDKKKQVGKINDREAFIYDSGESGEYLWFLSPSGFIHANRGLDVDELNYSQTASCLDYPYGEEKIGNIWFKTFKMRKTMNVYRGDGSYWGKVAAGCLVATNSNSMGSEHNTWKAINYVQSTSGTWVKVEGAGYNNGFVDTGLDKASGYSKIAFYGSW